MSLLKTIGSVLKKVAPSVIGKINPIAGAVVSAATALSKGAVRAGVPASVVRALPGVVGSGIGGGLILNQLPALPGGHTDTQMMQRYGGDGGIGRMHKKRRRKGITAKDLTSFKRVARLVDKYAKPVHHFRNIKK